MQIKDNYMLRKVSDSYVVVPVGAAIAEFNGMINLNEVGAFLWSHLEDEVTYDELLSAMLKNYEVAEEIAKADLNRFIENLKENNLLK